MDYNSNADVSESSSVRMERELDNGSNLQPEFSEEPGSLSLNESGSSLQEFDSEIQRMSRDADKILDSIRQEVSGKKKKQQERGIATRTISNASSAPSGEVDEEDDDMSDELNRLDEVTARIRESLDRKTADVDCDEQVVASPLKLQRAARASHFSLESSYSEQAASTESPRMSPGSKQIRQSAAVLLEKIEQTSSSSSISPSREPRLSPRRQAINSNNRATTGNKENHNQGANPQESAPAAAKQRAGASCSAEDNAKRLQSPAAAASGIPESLLIAVTITWAIVALLFVQAKFFLLDDNGHVRLPFQST